MTVRWCKTDNQGWQTKASQNSLQWALCELKMQNYLEGYRYKNPSKSRYKSVNLHICIQIIPHCNSLTNSISHMWFLKLVRYSCLSFIFHFFLWKFFSVICMSSQFRRDKCIFSVYLFLIHNCTRCAYLFTYISFNDTFIGFIAIGPNLQLLIHKCAFLCYILITLFLEEDI